MNNSGIYIFNLKKVLRIIETDNEKQLPWYLKNTPFFIISALVAPVAIIILLLNYRKCDKDQFSNRLFIAILLLIPFILYFLPKNLFTFFIAIIFYLFTGFLLLLKAEQK